MWSEPFDTDLPEDNEIAIYILEESTEGPIPHYINSYSGDLS
jgi:hypothetical protein